MPRHSRTMTGIMTATLCAALSVAAVEGTTLTAQPGDRQVTWSWDGVAGAVSYDLVGEDGVAVSTSGTSLTLPAVNGTSSVRQLHALAADGTVLATDALAAAGADLTAPDVTGVLASIHEGKGAGALVNVYVPHNLTDVDHVRVSVDGVLHGTHPVAPGQTASFHVATDDATGAALRWVELVLVDVSGNVSALLGMAGGRGARTGEFRTPMPPIGFETGACTASGAVVQMKQPGGASAVVVYRHDLATGQTGSDAVARTDTDRVTLPVGTYAARAFGDVASVPSVPFTVVSAGGVCAVTTTSGAWDTVATAAVSPGDLIAEVGHEVDRHTAPLMVAAVDPTTPTGDGLVDSRTRWAQRTAGRKLAGVEVLVDGVVVRTQGISHADDWQTTVPVDPTWAGQVTVRWIDLLGRRGQATPVALPQASARVPSAPLVTSASVKGDSLKLTLDRLDSATTTLRVLVDGTAVTVPAGTSIEVPLAPSSTRRTVVVTVSQLVGSTPSAPSAPVVARG